MQDSEVSLHSIDSQLKGLIGTFEKFSKEVLIKFKVLEDGQKTLEKGQKVLEDGHTEVMEFMRDHLITRDEVIDLHTELKQEISKSKHEIMSYVDKRDARYKGELISLIRKEDEKVNQTIIALEQTKTIAPQTAEQLKALGPFTSRLQQP